MIDNLVSALLELFNAQLTTFLVACLPVIELRGAIPIGIALDLSLQESFVISFIGSILPIPLIFFLVRPVFNYLRKTRIMRGFVEKMENKALSKGERVKELGFFWGLLLFVAIPLPGTGVWTGTLIAAMLDMKFKRVLPAVITGDFIAGVIVLIISYGAFSLFT